MEQFVENCKDWELKIVSPRQERLLDSCWESAVQMQLLRHELEEGILVFGQHIVQDNLQRTTYPWN
jgi:hypothetical protein